MTDTEILDGILALLPAVGTKGLQAIMDNTPEPSSRLPRDKFRIILKYKSIAAWVEWWQGYYKATQMFSKNSPKTEAELWNSPPYNALPKCDHGVPNMFYCSTCALLNLNKLAGKNE